MHLRISETNFCISSIGIGSNSSDGVHVWAKGRRNAPDSVLNSTFILRMYRVYGRNELVKVSKYSFLSGILS